MSTQCLVELTWLDYHLDLPRTPETSKSTVSDIGTFLTN